MNEPYYDPTDREDEQMTKADWEEMNAENNFDTLSSVELSKVALCLSVHFDESGDNVTMMSILDKLNSLKLLRNP